MAEADNPTTGAGMTVSEAATVFSKILDREDGKPEPEKQEQPSDTSEEEADETSSASDETPDEEPDEGDEDGADEEDGSDEEEEDGPATPDTAEVTVEIDGKPQKVTVQELKNGYLRQADYTRKTQALAEQRKALEPEFAQVREERAHYAAILPALAQQLQELQQAQAPDWDRLWAEDPIEWVRQKSIAEERGKRIEAAKAEMARLQQTTQTEQVRALQEHVNGQRELLQQLLPEARDKAKWDDLRPKLREYARELGFSEDEVKQAYDARAIVAMVKAMRYDELTKAKPRPNTPKAPTPAPAQAATPQRRHTELGKARMRLAKTGRVSDAAEVFKRIPGLI